MTWAENAKWRLYTDNILLNCGPLFQMSVLRTMTNIEDVRHQFLEREQRSRLVEERELIQGVDDEGNLAAPGRLYLQDTVINSPACWKGKSLDVQAIVARSLPPTLFVTVTMNAWREEMHRLGLDNEHTGAFIPQADKRRPFDRPDVVARVYNQYAHAVTHQLEKKSKDIFGLRCIAIAGKLEFQ